MLVDAYESTLAISISSSANPTIASIKTDWLERQAFDQCPFLCSYIKGEDPIFGGVVYDARVSRAYMILQLFMPSSC